MRSLLLRLPAAFLACTSLLALAPVPISASAFSDVWLETQYRTAIEALRARGVIEGYADGSFRTGNRINRAEFLKIVLEARENTDFTGNDCFPDVEDEWFAKYVCTAKDEDIVAGYPDGSFRPEREINFVEAAKILTLAYKQSTNLDSPDWYEPYARSLEGAKAIPPSVDRLEKAITRGEMVEMMWRLTEGVTDQPTKAYLNVKYPDLAINLSNDEPQSAKSCTELQAFAAEAARAPGYGRGGGVMMMEDAVGAPARSMGMEKAQDAYSQTNVQVEGVDEGDIVKTDGAFLYIVTGQKVRIVSAGTDMRLMSTIDLEEVGFSPTDLYVDHDRLIILGHRWTQVGGPPVRIMDSGSPPLEERMMAPSIWPGPSWQKAEARVYDIADRSKPELERKVAVEGSLLTSRKIEDKLYLVVNGPMRWGPIPLKGTEAELLPRFEDSKQGETDMPVSRCSDVVILPHIPSPQYLTVAVLDVDAPESDVEREVILGSAENVFASLENLYVAATEWRFAWNTEIDLGQQIASREKTHVYRFAFTEGGVDLRAQGSVPGQVLNQFSMDEHEGNFRIATTANEAWIGPDRSLPSTNALYVLNRDLEIVGRIEDIAPGERIYSARFIGDRAYLVTFKQIDPLFVIDTSEPRNPRILGKLKIPGVSDYLHPYDEDHLIGFGREAVEAKEGDFAWFQGLKIALFDVSDVEHPIELHSIVIGDRGSSSPLTSNHKALLFERDRNLFAFPVSVYDIPESQKKPGNESAYGTQVFQGAYVYDLTLKDGFDLRGSVTHTSEEDRLKAGDAWYAYGRDVERIVRIGDSLYTISQSGVSRHSEDDVSLEGTVEFGD